MQYNLPKKNWYKFDYKLQIYIPLRHTKHDIASSTSSDHG